jgi:hypothetical protein
MNNDIGVKKDAEELQKASLGNVEFERIEGILHGGYKQSLGRLSLNEDYIVTFTELDDSYRVQIRGEGGRLIESERVSSEDPYADLPSSDEELYSLLRQDVFYETLE